MSSVGLSAHVIICSLKMFNRLKTCPGFISASLDELLGEAPVQSVTVMIHKIGILLNRRRMDGQTPTVIMDDKNLFFPT